MIEWGAPLSFSAAKFDSLPTERFYSLPNNTLLLKDMVIRDLIATSTGMQLRWGKEYYRVPDPRGEGFVGVPVYDDEYERARAHDTLTPGARWNRPGTLFRLRPGSCPGAMRIGSLWPRSSWWNRMPGYQAPLPRRRTTCSGSRSHSQSGWSAGTTACRRQSSLSMSSQTTMAGDRFTSRPRCRKITWTTCAKATRCT